MRVSLRWLRDYVDLTLPPRTLAERLTRAGIEVAEVLELGATWDHIYVGRIVRVEPHPNADRLRLVTVDYGGGRTIRVVTGAPNVSEGAVVALALEGATLFDPTSSEPRLVRLQAQTIRGVRSEGMVCSERELGIGEDHTGILLLDPALPVGAPLREVLGDVIFELEVTPNRPDCLAMIGVAHEVAALTGQRVRRPPAAVRFGDRPIEEAVSVEIRDPDLCPRYMCSLIEGVTIGPSPRWLQDRLLAAGLRPINNVVDITNYVMLEWGQPLHAFDFERLRGRRIIVRRARPGEILRTLDGVERVLADEMLVIADAEGAVAVAGVMGGAESEVSPRTRHILLESANFNPVSIRRTARALKLASEASRRFEKGLPEGLPLVALERATALIQEIAGGTVRRGYIDCYPRPAPPRRVTVTLPDFERILGVRYTLEEITAVLEPLGFQWEQTDGALVVTPPVQRADIARREDIVEEVARIRGYETLPSTMPSGPLPEPQISPEWRWEETLRDLMVGCGFQEVITYSLTSRERLGRLLPEGADLSALAPLAREMMDRLMPIDHPPVLLVNPLSAAFECLRTTGFVSLLETLRDNRRHSDRDLFFFEIGRLYLPRPGELPEERRVLTAVAGAFRSGPQWGQPVEVDFFDLKGVAETVLERLAVGPVRFVPIEHPTFHPGRTAVILLERTGAVVGVVGEVAPAVRQRFDLTERAYLLGFDLSRLLPLATRERSYRPIPRVPPVIEDLAIVVDRTVPHERVVQVIWAAGQPLLRAVELFDVYEGPPVPPGKRSLAYRLVYQTPERTLTDAEVAAQRQRIIAAVRQELGAEIRG